MAKILIISHKNNLVRPLYDFVWLVTSMGFPAVGIPFLTVSCRACTDRPDESGEEFAERLLQQCLGQY